MSIVLKEVERSSKPASELKDGQLAVIVSWNPQRYIGDVVQRWGYHLICVGESKSQGWSQFFTPGGKIHDSRGLVRVLGDRDVLAVQPNNERVKEDEEEDE